MRSFDGRENFQAIVNLSQVFCRIAGIITKITALDRTLNFYTELTFVHKTLSFTNSHYKKVKEIYGW